MSGYRSQVMTIARINTASYLLAKIVVEPDGKSYEKEEGMGRDELLMEEASNH